MPFFEATSESEVSGGTFLDVSGDMNECKHDDYSIRTSGKNNAVTQINRPALINNGEGGQVTVHIHSSCQQGHLCFHGHAHTGCPIFPYPHSDHPSVYPQQPTFREANYQSNVSSAHQRPTSSFYGPAQSTSPVMMPTPSLPFNTPIMGKGAQKSSPAQMPVPKQAPLQGVGMPSALQDLVPISPATPLYQDASQRGMFDELQSVFFQPAFRLSIHDNHPETHWSSSASPQSPSTGHSDLTMSSPRSIDSHLVPLPPSPQLDEEPHGPINSRSPKHAPNMRPPARSYSETYLSISQRDDVPNFVNQNGGRLPLIPEHQWTPCSALSSEKEVIDAHESRSLFDWMPLPVDASQAKEIGQDTSRFYKIPPKERRRNVRSMTEMILPNPWD